MIYCIGRRFEYERALAGPAPVTKRGRGVDRDGRPYPGGWVWQDVEGARRFIAANGLTATHSVYGVEADWERDTEAGRGGEARRLARDAEVVRLI
ncbi:MAG: hypothetical protein WD036_09245 [Bauldia sp.]